MLLLPLTAAMLLQPRWDLPKDPAAVFVSFIQEGNTSTAKNATGQATHVRLQANLSSGARFWRSRADRKAANASVDALLQLSEEVLDQTAQLLPVGLNASAKPGRQREEQTLAALADHSGQLERLFHQLRDEMETQDGDGTDEELSEDKALEKRHSLSAGEEEQLALRAGEQVQEEEAHEDAQAEGETDKLRLFSEAPAAHRIAAAAGIGDSLLAQPTMAGTMAHDKAAPPQHKPVVRHDTGSTTGAKLGVAFLVLCVFLVGVCAYVLQNRLEDSKPEEKPAESPRPTRGAEPREGKTSYVVRVVRVRVEGLTAQALAWQLQVGDQQPRPSRFATNWVWDAPVDRLDVDVDSPTEKLSIALLEQPTSLLDPPTTIANVELAAGVLLAEARKHQEKVKSSRQADQYVHEKRFALPRGGSLVLEYSLIAFFHWYVGGEHAARA